MVAVVFFDPRRPERGLRFAGERLRRRMGSNQSASLEIGT